MLAPSTVKLSTVNRHRPRLRRSTRASSGRVATLLIGICGLLLVTFLLLPVAVIVWRGAAAATSGGFSSPAVLAALTVSAQTTLLTLLIAVVLGTPIAYGLAHFDFRGKSLLDALLDLPIVLPPVVAGLGLLLTFGRNGLLGDGIRLANLELAFSPAAVVMAQLFVAAPYFIRAARVGFAGVEPDIVSAALTDGATPLQAFCFVTWPLSRTALLEGAVLTWTRALGEFGATILFAGSLEGKTRTITLGIYSALESDLDAALTLAGGMALLAFVVLFAFRVTLGKGRA
jgi:molybdate transport system permease protein